MSIVEGVEVMEAFDPTLGVPRTLISPLYEKLRVRGSALNTSLWADIRRANYDIVPISVLLDGIEIVPIGLTPGAEIPARHQ